MDSGTCLPTSGTGALGASCQTFADCQSGYCVDLLSSQQCGQTCGATDECPGELLCLGLGGGGACLPTSVLSQPYYPGDAGVGDACTIYANPEQNDCHSTYACYNSNPNASTGLCSDSCGSSSECDATGWYCVAAPINSGIYGTYCNQGYLNSKGKGQGSACRADSDCQRGECYKGICSDPCCSDNDCEGYACSPILQSDGSVVRLCLVPGNVSGASAGGACGVDSDCRSGLCVPTNPYGTFDAGGYCSSLCCRDADCPGLVPGSTCQITANGLTWRDGGLAGGGMGVCFKK